MVVCAGACEGGSTGLPGWGNGDFHGAVVAGWVEVVVIQSKVLLHPLFGEGRLLRKTLCCVSGAGGC